jgi:DNA invertase Pin-like site-specific DNA recombinase
LIKPGKRIAFYLRVSTTEQDTSNQRRELDAVAARHGWNVTQVFEDAGISGTRGRDKRPQFDALLKAVTRREIDAVAAWSVDRLGRSMQHLVEFLEELRDKGVDLYLHQQGLDSSTPSGRAMFQMCGVFAEYERAILQERVRAGMARAKAAGKHVGRPPLAPELAKRLKAALAEPGRPGIRVLAKRFGVNPSTVQKLAHEPVPQG